MNEWGNYYSSGALSRAFKYCKVVANQNWEMKREGLFAHETYWERKGGDDYTPLTICTNWSPCRPPEVRDVYGNKEHHDCLSNLNGGSW